MCKLIAALTATVSILSSGMSTAAGQNIPPGYEIVQITATPYRESSPRMNSRGQIVWMAQIGADVNSREIFLYDDSTGNVTQLTDNGVHDNSPAINDDGTIVWMMEMGPHTPEGLRNEIMVRDSEGNITRLTDNDFNDSRPEINHNGQIAWLRADPTRGCVGADNIMFFDGESIIQITDNQWSNQSVELNDDGQLIWTEYDFCPGGQNWRSLIKLYSKGEITTLSLTGLQSQSPTLNDHGVAAWRFNDPSSSDEGIYIRNGDTTYLLTPRGHAPKLNDDGNMYLIRWHQNSQNWQAWMYLNGRFKRLTNDSDWHTDGDINDLAEVCWHGGPLGEKDIWYLRRFELGDLNCDGAVDAFDIEWFLQALFDSENFPRDCDPTLADINQDDSIDALDIEPFIALLFP